MGFYTRLYIMYSIYNDKLYITITIQHYLYTCSISICLRFDCWSHYMRFSCCGIHKTHREWLWNQTHLLHSNLHLLSLSDGIRCVLAGFGCLFSGLFKANSCNIIPYIQCCRSTTRNALLKGFDAYKPFGKVVRSKCTTR